MSEANGDGEAGVGRGEIWIEKYRPQGLGDVLGQEDITERLQSYIDRDELPHLLFAGPAGVGKCVTGDTPILTNQGVQFISDIVGDIEGFGEPEDGLQIVTFENGEFRYVTPDKIYSRHAKNPVSISTRDGGEFRVTPEHKLLILDNDGYDWIQARDLTPGDRVVRPLETPSPDRSNTLNWIEFLDGDRIFAHVTREFAETHSIPIEENYTGGKKEVLRRLRREQDIDTIAEEVDLPRETIRKYIYGFADIDLTADSTICSLRYLRELDLPDEDVYNNVLKIQYVNANNARSDPITPPDSITPSLARFLGLTIAEASVDNGRIKFYNNDDTLLEDFENSAREVFGVIPEQGKQKGVSYRRIGNRTITHFLSANFDCFESTGNGEGIGSSLVTANDECYRVFLRSFFDAEGYIDNQGIIELTQKNGDLITLLSYLLSRFGIRSRRKTKEKEATNAAGGKAEYHVLYISGSDDLRKFKENIGFGIQRKADRLSETVGRRANTNTDTIPRQSAVDTLSDRLNLEKSKLVSDSLDPRSPGRNNYQKDINRVLDAATERMETAQTMLEVVEGIQSDVENIGSVPMQWVDSREHLAPIEKRRALSIRHAIRTDRLLEYADGRRTPYSNRAAELLVDLNAFDNSPPIDTVKTQLRTAISSLEIKYNHLAEGIDLRGTEIINLLNSEDLELSSLSRFAIVADQIKSAISNMLSEEVLEALVTLESITSEKIHLDEITKVEVIQGKERVYDLTVSGSRNYVAGNIPTVMHNTTSAVTIAKTIYGDDWRENFLELNASDERGIDVVRDRIKNFARSSFGGHDYRIIFLDEADSLTDDAQSALRRTMEQFSNNTRFILSVNYSSKIIDPIQSRCAVFRFSPIPDEAVAEQIRLIAETEGIEVTDEGVDALVYAANGDMRKAINGLQAAAVLGETVDEEAVFTITSTARPEEIESMVTSALDGDFTAARSVLDDLLTDKGLAGGDIIDQLHRSIWEFGLDDEAAVRLLDRIGEADYRIAEGAHERVQLEALLAAIALESRD